MVNKFLYPRGGAETYILKIANYLKGQGHEVQFFGMFSKKNIVGNDAEQYTKEMDFHTSKMKRLLYPFKIIYSFEAKRKIKKIINDFKPDVIHLNNINFQLTPSIIDVAYKMKIPVVQTVHDYQMICPNHLLYNKNGICEKCINGSKWNCTKYNCIHGSKVKSIIGSIEAILYTKILGTYKKVSKYICPSSFLESKLLQASDIYKSKTLVLQNYIELDQESKEKKEDYVLFFGRLSEEKGLKIFIEVCKKLPDIKFKIAGTGDLENLCENASPNIEYVGFKSGKNLKNLIAKAQFSVYPSIWYENCPFSILESESLGTPVITANYGGMKEMVEDGKTGILIDKITVNGLQQAITDLYNNKSKIEEMSKHCIEKRTTMITLSEYCNKLMGVYKNII